MNAETNLKKFEIGDFNLQSGNQLKEAILAYQTYGKLNRDRSNAILYPTHYAGDHTDNEKLIGPNKIFDTRNFFVIVPNMFGNGLSTSPSKAHSSQLNNNFPLVTVLDNVKAQNLLLEKVFKINKLEAIYGWSMGGQQAYQWASYYPEKVKNMICCCSSARTSEHNQVFLEGLRATLCADLNFSAKNPSPEAGLRAFARVYAGWAYSQSFYREKVYTHLGFKDWEALLHWWEEDHIHRNGYDLLAMLNTWKHSDISNNVLFNGDIELALNAIRANALLIPGATDLYFPPEDNLLEKPYIKQCTYKEIPSVWGHIAGSPSRNGEDFLLLSDTIKTHLAQSKNQQIQVK